MARVETQCNRKIKILKAAEHTVIKCTGSFSSYALSVQTAVKQKATRKMTNNVYWNRKVYFQESDKCVSKKEIEPRKNVYRKYLELHGCYYTIKTSIFVFI
jgi:hypothetical protein